MSATTIKEKCKNPECSRVAVQKGFCKPSIGSGKTAQIQKRILNEKQNARYGFRGLVNLRKSEDAELIEKINEKMQERGITFNVLAIRALARMLGVKGIEAPKAGRPEKQEVEF